MAKKVAEKAQKSENGQSHDYEMIVIISPEVAEEKFGTTIDGISQFITGKGGSVSEVEQWGKRKLAYPIKNFMEGSYVLTRFKMAPALSKELEASLRISDAVLRHLLIKVES